jgi:hypothetical protein
MSIDQQSNRPQEVTQSVGATHYEAEVISLNLSSPSYMDMSKKKKKQNKKQSNQNEHQNSSSQAYNDEQKTSYDVLEYEGEIERELAIVTRTPTIELNFPFSATMVAGRGGIKCSTNVQNVVVGLPHVCDKGY